MANGISNYVTGYSFSWHQLLRRSVQHQIFDEHLASQFTQSEAKGHSLVLQQFYSTIVAVAYPERSEAFSFHGINLK